MLYLFKICQGRKYFKKKSGGLRKHRTTVVDALALELIREIGGLHLAVVCTGHKITLQNSYHKTLLI